MKHNLDKFRGITVALYSAFTEKGTVDSDATKALTNFYIDKGVKGLYVCGSTGEGLLMSVEERKQTLEAVMAVAKGKITINVHIGSAATRDAVELAKHAEQLGADAVSAIPSVYYRLSEDAIYNSWVTMMNASDLPFIIYNIPQLTGYNMSKKLFDRLLSNPKLIGIKNSSESVFDSLQFKKWGGEDFLVFHGMDEHLGAGLMIGADGGIGGTYGIMPELYLRMEKLVAEKRLEEVTDLQQTINEIIIELCSFPSMYGSAKAIMGMRGVQIGKPRLPFLPCTDADKPRLEALYKKIMSAINKE